MAVYATIGVTALYLLFIWLLSASGAAWVAQRKGYGERFGLFFGLILSVVGLVIVLILPARAGSTWKIEGALPNPGARRPLGLATIGSGSAAEGEEVLGPSLGDVPAVGPPASSASQPLSEPQPLSEAQPSSEPQASSESQPPSEPPAGGDPPEAG